MQLVAGHDIGAVLPPSGYTYGLKQLHASGLPIAEVLTAATSRAAAAVGLAGVTGVLAPGYAADLIVAAGDPLADLSALDHLVEIVIAGRTFVPDPVAPFDPEQLVAGDGPRPSDARAAWLERQERRQSHLAALSTQP